MAIKESYMNDFSSGLVSKKLYSRTDLELFRKGLPDIKGAIPNVFGNMDNFDFDLNGLDSLVVDESIKNKIANNDFLFATLDYGNCLFFTERIDALNTKLVEFNLTTMSIKNCTIYHESDNSALKVLCYAKQTNSLLLTGNNSYFITLPLESNLTLYPEKLVNRLKSRMAYSEIIRGTYVEMSGDKFGLASINGYSVNKATFSYDPRNSIANISLVRNKGIHGDTPIIYPNSNFKNIELEIMYGKFQYSGTGDVWNVIKAPIKDTLKVATDGTITVETKDVSAESILFSTLYPDSFYSYIEDAFVFGNRMCLVKGNKMLMSKVGDFLSYANTENGDTEAVALDFPFEKYKASFVFDDLILFSNRGVFNTQGFVTPTNSNLKYISSVIISDTIKPVALYNGVNFVNKDNDEVFNVSFNGETQVYNCNNLSSTLDFKNIKNLDIIISNETTSESLLVTDENRTFLFNFNVTEQIKFWTSLDKKYFEFSFFNENGELNYLSIDKVLDNNIIKNSIDYKHSNFMFKLFKPDTNKGQFKPNFFDKNIIVNQVEIMYTGNGKISVHNNSKATSDVIVDKRIFTNTPFDITFDSEVKIAKSRTNFMYGDDVSFFVETDDKFSIYAVNLYME